VAFWRRQGDGAWRNTGSRTVAFAYTKRDVALVAAEFKAWDDAQPVLSLWTPETGRSALPLFQQARGRARELAGMRVRAQARARVLCAHASQ
jgi:hypothetical protein